MKFGTALAAALMIMTVGFASAQDGKMKAKAMTGMKAVPVKAMTKADWQAMYNQAEKLFAKKDADTLFKYMTSDFTMSSMGETANAADSKKKMKEWFATMKSIKATMTVTKATQKGTMATVTDTFKMSGTMMMPGKKTAKMVSWGTETATWVKMGGKWMMKKLVTTDEKMTMNGKPFDPSKSGG